MQSMLSKNGRIFRFLGPLSKMVLMLGNSKAVNLKTGSLTLVLESMILIQFLVHFIWLEFNTHTLGLPWLFTSLGISSVLLDLSSKLLNFSYTSVSSNTKRLLTCLGKLCNTVLVEIIFVLVFEKHLSAPQNMKFPFLFNMIINFALTTLNLSFGYLSMGYIIIIYFFTFLIITCMGLVYQESEPFENTKFSNIEYFGLYCTNIITFIVVTLEMRKFYLSLKSINKILKESSMGKAIIEEGNKDILFANESIRKMINKSKGCGIRFDDLNAYKYNRFLKLAEIPSIILSSDEAESPRTEKGLQRTKMSLVQILDALKQSPSKVLTVYTSLDSNDSEALKGTEGFNSKPRHSTIQTDGNLLESENHQYEVKISYLDRKQYKDRYIYIQFSDITELRKILETERNIEFKTKVLHSFSHELKTPINISRNMLELMIMDEELPESIGNKYACVVLESVNHLDLLIQDIIDFLKIEASHFHLQISQFSLKTLLEEVVKAVIKRVEEHDIEIILTIESFEDFIVSTDRARLKSVLLNVLSYEISISSRCSLELSIKTNDLGNFEFSLKKLSTRIEKIPKSTTIKFKKDGLAKNLSVHPENNFGIAISRILLSKLRECGVVNYHIQNDSNDGVILEFTIKPSIEGFDTSLGKLETNHTRLFDSPLLRRQKTSLTLASCKKGQPEMFSSNDIILKSPSNIPEPCKTCPRVLIVDDDSFNLLSMNMLLEKLNLFSIKATNGIEAISNLVKHQKEHFCLNDNCKGIELILMDLMMPEMNGLDCSVSLLRMMKEGEIPNIPIIACTANDSKDVIESCQKIGFKEILSKPISLNTLSKTVAPLLVMS